MALENEYYRRLSDVVSAPPEQQAVRTLGPLSSAIGGAMAGQQAQTMRLGTSMLGGNAELAQAKRDMRLAGRDSGLALGVTAINTGLQGLGAYEMGKAAEQQRMREREEADYWNALGEIVKTYYNDIIKKLSPEPSTPQATPKSDWTMEGRGY